MSSTTLATLTHAIIGISIIASVTVLLALHDLTESTAIALYGAAITLVSGSALATVALKVPAPVEQSSPVQAPSVHQMPQA